MPLTELFDSTTVAKHVKASREFVEREARRLGCYSQVGAHMLFTAGNVDELLRAWRPAPLVSRLAQIANRGEDLSTETHRPYTAASLAEEWGCSANHVRNLVKSGKLGHFLIGMRLIRIPFAAALEYQEQNPAAVVGAIGGDQ